MPNENNKRIVKNTVVLYFRMLLIMGVSLYTVRVVLKTLGVVDYGINNVVGGIVVMFSFLSATMAGATQRFFAFELGKKDYIQLKHTFSLTITIYFAIGLIILLMGETLGLWFINNKLVIPQGRIGAANWVYQFSIFSFLVTMMTIPYEAAIIAHEDMNIYAYVSIIEVILKLAIVYILVFSPIDKLKLYAELFFITTFTITFIYRTICKRKYEECRFKFYWDRKLFDTLLSYSGWNLFGAGALVLNNQGINILLNIFFGPSVNAARGIAYQINNAVTQFVNNFFTAVKPQITKYYATEERQQMMLLIFRSSKLSYFLLLMLSIPVLLETNFILSLWLKIVPEYTTIFIRLIIIMALIDSLSFSLMSAAQATGRIKLYQSVVGGTLLLNLPISYYLLKKEFPPQVTQYVAIVISIICLYLRLLLLKRMISFPVFEYFKRIILPVFIVTMIAVILPLLLSAQIKDGYINFFTVGFFSFLCSSCAIYSVGLNSKERLAIYELIRNSAFIKKMLNII